MSALVCLWALAFVAFERAYPPRDGDSRHPAEVMLAGLITPLDFLGYVLPQHPPEGVEFKCCRSWIPYPRPGRNTICPECGSEFFIRTQATISQER